MPTNIRPIVSMYSRYKVTCSTCIHYRGYGRIFYDGRPAGKCEILQVYVQSTRLPPCYDMYYVTGRNSASASNSDSDSE